MDLPEERRGATVDSLWGGSILITGLLVFCARVVDVSMGTMRTISIVQGRTTTAFFLGALEVSLWLAIISTVLEKISANPILAVFYALGFSTGNVVGIKLERRLAMGTLILRVISASQSSEMATRLREAGFGVTTFQGEGKSGPVVELYIVCRRRDMKIILPIITGIDPEAFYVTEQVGLVSKVYRPLMHPLTGWRSVLKKK